MIAQMWDIDGDNWNPLEVFFQQVPEYVVNIFLFWEGIRKAVIHFLKSLYYSNMDVEDEVLLQQDDLLWRLSSRLILIHFFSCPI